LTARVPDDESPLSFCVVIPMYNEESGAGRCVREVSAVLDKLPERSRLIVVEDGSRDGTRETLERLTAEAPKLMVLPHTRNLGYGKALRTGVEQAVREHFDYVLFMDSDLTNDPTDIPRFVMEMKRGTDMIKASRYTGNGRMEGVPFARAIVSRVGNLVARFLFGVGLRDCTNGFRAVRVPILEKMDLRENGFAIIVEELYQAKFLASTYAEVPVVLMNRSSELRPTSFSYKPGTFIRYLRYAMKARLGIHPTPGVDTNAN